VYDKPFMLLFKDLCTTRPADFDADKISKLMQVCRLARVSHLAGCWLHFLARMANLPPAFTMMV
jgi:hypothetical protein